jgi:hypothetical protein
MLRSQFVLPHFAGNWEGKAIAADGDQMDLPAAPDPSVAEVRYHALHAAAQVHPVYVDADFHLR